MELDKASHAAWQAACKTPANKGLRDQAELQNWAWAAVSTATLDNVRLRNCILQPATAAVEAINDETAFNPCFLLRDLFIYPLHAESICGSRLTGTDGAVVKQAQKIYDERAFERLPILADVLELAGCDDASILGHCRQLERHFRGCWVVDLLVGKK
jgi:hypothetical protein